jgi:hypothetical protein
MAIQLPRCKHCNEEFLPRQNKQEFCCTDHQQKFNRSRYRAMRINGGTVEATPEQSAIIRKLVEPLISKEPRSAQAIFNRGRGPRAKAVRAIDDIIRKDILKEGVSVEATPVVEDAPPPLVGFRRRA